MKTVLSNALEHWPHVAPLVARPRDDAEFATLVAYLDALLDTVGDDEQHPLIGLVDVLGDVVSAYEQTHIEEPLGSGVEALRYLMAAHGLRQTDLPEVGSQGVVSEILSGRRSLNLRQIKALAGRFGVRPATFVD